VTADSDDIEEVYESQQLVLSDLINRVLDKGVVISANITIGIADVDLIQLDLRLLISSVTTLQRRMAKQAKERGDLSVRPRPRT
jgi:gas vesicle protein GvpA/GvpJ/GvpM family